MRKTTRQVLFFFFAGAFLVSAPLVVLYTAGYRVSLNNYRVLETGALATNSSPRGATVFVDGKKESSKTPAVVQTLLPHDTVVRFERAGYISWEQTVPVQAGRTTYVSAILFADTTPETVTTFAQGSTLARSTSGRYLLALEPNGNRTAVTLYDNITRFGKPIGELPPSDRAYSVRFREDESLFIVSEDETPVIGYTENGEEISGDALTSPDVHSPLLFTNNGKNIEVRSARSSSGPLLTLLPLSSYSVVASDDEFAVVKDEHKMLTVISLLGNNSVNLDVAASVISWLPDQHLLAWSDGIEVNLYNAESGEKTFITRQSDIIKTLLWHPSGNALFLGTANHVTAVDRDAYANRVSTLLVDSAVPLSDIWLDRSGKTLFLLKTVGGAPTLERRKLVQ